MTAHCFRHRGVGLNTEKDRNGLKRDRKGPKRTEKDRKARNHILLTEKEGNCNCLPTYHNYFNYLPPHPPTFHSSTLPPVRPPSRPPTNPFSRSLPPIYLPTHVLTNSLVISLTVCLSFSLFACLANPIENDEKRQFSCPKCKQSHHINYPSTQPPNPPSLLACILASLSYNSPSFSVSSMWLRAFRSLFGPLRCLGRPGHRDILPLGPIERYLIRCWHSKDWLFI